MSPSKRGAAPGSEQAKHSGQAVREKYGADFYRQIGQKGGQSVKAQRGAAFYAEIGRKGGEAAKAHHGFDFYSRIGKTGGRRVASAPHKASTPACQPRGLVLEAGGFS